MKISNQLPSTPASPTDAEVVAVWAAEAVLPPNQLAAVLASTVTTGGEGNAVASIKLLLPLKAANPVAFQAAVDAILLTALPSTSATATATGTKEGINTEAAAAAVPTL